MKSLRQAVKEIVLNEIDGYTREDAESYFNNPQEHTYASNLAACSIYYKNIEEFAIKHHDEIIDLMIEANVLPMKLKKMAFFAFKTIVPTLRDEIMEENYEFDWREI